MALATFALAILVSNMSKPLAGLLVIVAVLLRPLYWLSQTFGLLSITFTQIEMNPPAPGSAGQAILGLRAIAAEVMRRWEARAYMRQRESARDVERETKKFEWLRRGVIDDERLQRAMPILNASKARPSDSVNRELDPVRAIYVWRGSTKRHFFQFYRSISKKDRPKAAFHR